MDRAVVEPNRFSVIAHRERTFLSPISTARVESLIELLRLSPDARVLDIGCGKAGILLSIASPEGRELEIATHIDTTHEQM